MARTHGITPIGAVLAVIVALAAAGSGFPFSSWPGTAGAGGKAAVQPPRRPASPRPSPRSLAGPSSGLAPLASEYACAASLVGGTPGPARADLSCLGVAAARVTYASPVAGVVSIYFGRDLSRCAVSVTPRLAGLTAGTAPGEISVDLAGRAAGQVVVRTFSQSGRPAARGLSLAIQCPPPADHGVAVIRYPERSVSFKVPCGMTRTGVVIATAQDLAGPRVRWAAASPRRCAVRIGLTAAPRPGRPARIGWRVLP